MTLCNNGIAILSHSDGSCLQYAFSHFRSFSTIICTYRGKRLYRFDGEQSRIAVIIILTKLVEYCII